MTDEEILDKYIDLSNSDLTLDEKGTLMNIIKKHKQAFSLKDKIGQCPNIKIDIDVIDDSPFFVQPFLIHEEDKPIMDRYMAKLVSLGILTKNNTTHTSPVMLVARKGTKNKRPVVDFRLLNTRIMRRNTATPLLRDIFKMLGRSKCEVLSCVDLKDAFHSLGLTDKAKDFCGILPYFGSPHYRYEVLPMGLSISPPGADNIYWKPFGRNPQCASLHCYYGWLNATWFENRPHATFQTVANIPYPSWLETLSQKMSAFHETLGIPWKCFPHRKWCNYHYPHEK